MLKLGSAEPTAPTSGAPSPARQKTILALAFLVIILVSLLAFYTTHRLIAASQKVEQAHGILTETNRFLAELRDVESAARGYVVSGEERHLQAHARAVAQAQAARSSLTGQRVSATTRQRLDRLFLLADRRVELSRRLIAARNSPAAMRAMMSAGTDVMDRLKQQGATIVANQSENYRRERAEIEVHERRTGRGRDPVPRAHRLAVQPARPRA